ncbi:MAG: hypothetical protein QNK03_27435 [Myxococcota bacterium]|nr:hypothetical protein [Myxococcota bacterium]
MGRHARVFAKLAIFVVALGALLVAAPAGAQDRDADGVPDGADNCLEVGNRDQRDTDSDGFGNACDPDYNDDGLVGIPDFNVLRGQFGKDDGDPDFDPDVDANGDGAVGIPDFNVLRAFFGQPPGPAGEPSTTEGGSGPPQIAPPAQRDPAPLKPDPRLLPEGARARFPAFDGDSFYVTLPIKAGLPGAQLQELLGSILNGVGYGRASQFLTPPPDGGVSPPPADFDGLAQVVAFEYESMPEFLRPRTRNMIEAFLTRKSSPEIDAALETGEGMDFAQFVAGIERRRILFPLMQRLGDVPIEHAGVIAAAWEGQLVSSVYGSLYNEFSVENSPSIPQEEAAKAGLEALDALDDVVAARPPEPNDCGLDYRRVSVDVGGSGFFAAVFEQISDFALLRRVVRGCQTGGPASAGNDRCDGQGGGELLDFVVLQGDLRDSNLDPDGRGVPGGARDVTIRVANHGRLGGPGCGSTGVLGWLAPEGFDCLRDTRDDAGGKGVFGAEGSGLPGADGVPGTADDLAAPLVSCLTRVVELPNGTELTDDFQEQCVVDFDQDADGDVENAVLGNPSSGPTIGETPGNETSNARLACLVAPLGTPELVLLPAGDAGGGGVRLQYAWRMLLTGLYEGQVGEFLLWLDAESARILKLNPLLWDTDARGIVFNRDPGIGSISQSLEVDPASGGQYVLKLTGLVNRVDYLGDGFDALDVSIPDVGGGSSATFANFDQAPINDAAEALCASGTNKGFQQVNFFSVFYRLWRRTLDLGVFRPFPTTPWSPRVESASAGCNAWSSMNYGACQGYYNAACPSYTNGLDIPTAGFADNRMNYAHDNTVVAHELAHNSTARFTENRPTNWCGMPACAIPVGYGGRRGHDLADFWADTFYSTNCTGGWVSKNIGGVDNRLYCANNDDASENGYTPRLHQVTVPFNPASPGDHFPEHRAISTDSSGYSDAQIYSAALWEVRLGMRSKCRPSGLPQFEVRFARALKEAGFLPDPPTAGGVLQDIGLYALLLDLEIQMIEQWATSGSPGGPPAFRHNGPHTTSKVTAGFAKAGVFVLPAACLDGDGGTSDPASCPGGENGGDAVIDIDDMDPGDDLDVQGVNHPEVDFLELGGPAPRFHVWTGPRYRLSGASGAATFSNPSPCNARFQVEVATDPAFPGATTILSGFTTVDRNPGTAGSAECYGTWTPSAGEWTTLQAGGAGTRIYYRARTTDGGGGNERLSTEPGNGLYTVPPPYAVITSDGRSDY